MTQALERLRERARMNEKQEIERRIELKQQEILLFLQEKTKELQGLFDRLEEIKNNLMG